MADATAPSTGKSMDGGKSGGNSDDRASGRSAAVIGSCARAGRRITLPGTYVVAPGDTLWQIAESYYNNGERYRAIARVNRASIGDPDMIYPCQRVYLPARRPR
jgi:nucleoid-associated protein YgaU